MTERETEATKDATPWKRIEKLIKVMRNEAENISPVDGVQKGNGGHAPEIRRWASYLDANVAAAVNERDGLLKRIATLEEALGTIAKIGREDYGRAAAARMAKIAEDCL